MVTASSPKKPTRVKSSDDGGPRHAVPVGGKGRTRSKAALSTATASLVVELPSWRVREVPGKEIAAEANTRKMSAAHRDLLSQMQLVRSVIERSLDSLREVQDQMKGVPETAHVLQKVADSLAEKAALEQDIDDVDLGWQELLERGLKRKSELLRSGEFKSTSEASTLLAIGEHAIRKRIKEQRLFALRSSSDAEYRIPAWALDPQVAGAATKMLLSDASEWTDGAADDDWSFHHFMSTPNGRLNGLRPFECLMADAHLPLGSRHARQELLSHLALPIRASLLPAVREALRAELSERPQT